MEESTQVRTHLFGCMYIRKDTDPVQVPDSDWSATVKSKVVGKREDDLKTWVRYMGRESERLQAETGKGRNYL